MSATWGEADFGSPRTLEPCCADPSAAYQTHCARNLALGAQACRTDPSRNNLAAFLSELGRREEALAAAQEAADLYRDLARARPEAFTPDLAGSLNNLAACLSELGRREEALAAAQEAADLYRDLARARPEAFTPDLAMSLNNLANRLSDLGRREEALAAAQEAAEHSSRSGAGASRGVHARSGDVAQQSRQSPVRTGSSRGGAGGGARGGEHSSRSGAGASRGVHARSGDVA